MTIFRNPVDGAFIPFPLACVDVDPVSGGRVGNTCQRRRDAHPKDQRKPFFKCPNRQNGASGSCDTTTFLYPRRWAKGGHRFHFHQGLDIFASRGTPIRSVTNGVVRVASKVARDGFGGYGMVVVIETLDLFERTHHFLYGHCDDVLVHEGEVVSEQQVIATVGTTCFSKGSPSARFGDAQAHLHFEVSTRRYPYDDERAPGEPMTEDGRCDPRVVLERLGPWGMTEVHIPLGETVDADVVAIRHSQVEASPHGGFFPLGANNHWHGGIHLPAPQGSPLVAPFDATIVAARLDPDPAHAVQAGGSSNFILLRHEIPEIHYALFQGKGARAVEVEPPRTTSPKDRAVGTRSRCANQPTDVSQVKHQLHAHHDERGRPYYDPGDPADLDAGTVTHALEQAIRAFQADEVETIDPDGVVDIPGKTWTALHDGKPPEEPKHEPNDEPKPRSLDPHRVLYSLLMHLQPLKVDRALAKDFPWLSQVHVAPDPSEPDPAEEEAQREREEDLAEADHALSGAVGAPYDDGTPASNHPDDVHWVHQRLIRLGDHPGPPSISCDEALIAAIRKFQNQHHPSFKSEGNGDGRVDKTGKTAELLRKTRAALLGGSGGSTSTIDPVFVHRTTVRDDHGVAKVITGLDVKVRSGEALWRSGQSLGYAPDGRSTMMLDQIHWELFSEHLLVGDWEEPLQDDTNDLTADVPERLLEFIEDGSPELARDGLLRVDEVRAFYGSGRAEFLRRTPCRFVSHWGLDVDQAVARLEAMGFDVEGLPELLRPFMWWDQAIDVLPPTRLVWHYDPIELLAQYAEHLATLRPQTHDPETHPTLTVRVLYDNRVPMPGVEVQLLDGIEVLRTAKTGRDGEATFPGVPVGAYGVRVRETATGPIPLEMRPRETNVLEIVTEVTGPPPPRGSIHVIVRKHTKTIAGDDVEVWLSHATAGLVAQDITHNGKVSFEGILHGDYTIEAGDAKAVAVTLDEKSKNVTVILPAPVGVLRMELVIGDAKGAREPIDILVNDEAVASLLTDDDGVADFELPEGRYEALAGNTKKRVRVEAHARTHCVMTLDEGHAPTPAEGTTP